MGAICRHFTYLFAQTLSKRLHKEICLAYFDKHEK
jgi:hypothetical protein